MTLSYEATLAVLGRAVLDLTGQENPATLSLRRRLAELSPLAQRTAQDAVTLTGYRPPDWQHPLAPVFSLLAGAGSQHLLPLPLQATPVYPKTAVAPDEQGRAAEATRAALLENLGRLPPEPNQLLFLLEKYASGVSTGEPGLAFGDLARLAAATAGALAHGAQRLRLVGADFSGIQRFIYTISAKGALKGLRARSFFLELLAQDVARRLLERLALTRANLIYAGGGHIFLLVPDTPVAEAAVAAVQAEFNQWLLADLGGSLYLAVGTAGFPPQLMAPDSEGVPALWREVSARVARDKAARFHQQVSEADFWSPRSPGQARCQVCHRETDSPLPLHPPEADEPAPLACPLCAALYNLGGDLPHAHFVAIGNPGGGESLRIGDAGYYLCATAEEVQRTPGRAGVLVMAGLQATDYALPDAYPLWTCRYAQASSNGRSAATFEELAEKATGKPLIGVLRLDVDNLGRLFAGGLPAGRRDFARVAALSRSLTHFFRLHLDSLCAGDLGEGLTPLRLSPGSGPRPVTVVYSGGDDLFLVGAWNQVLELAFDIRRAFARYTGGTLTLSGGTVAREFHGPIHRLAEEAGEAEADAKDNGKDSISPLYAGRHLDRQGRPLPAALKWAQAEALLQQVLEPALGPLGRGDRPGTRLPRAFIYRLMGLADVHRQHGALYLPRLAYLLARIDEGIRRQPAWQKLREYLMTHDVVDQLPPLLRWLDLLGRGGVADER